MFTKHKILESFERVHFILYIEYNQNTTMMKVNVAKILNKILNDTKEKFPEHANSYKWSVYNVFLLIGYLDFETTEARDKMYKDVDLFTKDPYNYVVWEMKISLPKHDLRSRSFIPEIETLTKLCKDFETNTFNTEKSFPMPR